ncbi:MAG TPA: TonB-dependent receptor [Vicinamibacterales bacterium]
MPCAQLFDKVPRNADKVPTKLAIAILLLMFAAPAMAQTGGITGTIVDARDGTPLEKVSVRVQDTGLTTLTAHDGRFQLDGGPAGRHELYVSSVDYILVRRFVDVPDGDILVITIPIAAGTGTYSETVNVNSGADEQTAPSQQVLRSNELQQLRGVITNDPMRAIHVLPGVATGDDLRSEFSVRGLPVRNMNFTFEGIATPLLVHTVQGVQDTGSIAMVNGDVLNEIGLAAGSYPQLHGNHTGAELNFLMREGSRDRLRGQFRPSITDTSLVLEGPLGSSKSGSWLISARKSYLGSVIKRIDPENTFAFGFHDAQVKLVRDLTPAHQLQFGLTVGRSRLDQDPESLGRDEVQDGVNDTGVAVITWRYLVSPRFVLTQKVAADANTSRNVNLNGIELYRARRRDLMYRTDWTYSRSPRVMLEGGGEIRWASESRFEQSLELLRPEFAVRESLSASAIAASSYVLTRMRKGRAVIAPGVRVDHSTLTGHTSASPWFDSRWPLSSSFVLRAGGGIYRQEPEFAEVKGLRGSDLDALRSYHADVGIEGPLVRSVTWQLSGYNREDRDYPWLPDAEFRIADGRLVLPSFTTRYENALDGHSRGVELVVQRRSPNGLSGWIAYNLATTRYRNALTGEEFAADYDQRHTLNVYGVYRFSDRMSFSSRFRAGSNFPVPGYYESRETRSGQSPAYFLSTSRNNVRVPVYSRLDLRANRTFSWRTTRFTLFAEALNIYARENVRASTPGINGITHQVFGLFDSMFPFIPSAGLSVEF